MPFGLKIFGKIKRANPTHLHRNRINAAAVAVAIALLSGFAVYDGLLKETSHVAATFKITGGVALAFIAVYTAVKLRSRLWLLLLPEPPAPDRRPDPPGPEPSEEHPPVTR